MESNLLPPKKFFGKLNPDYVEKRREGLEKYLQSVLEGFDEALPVVLQQFLEADRYVSRLNHTRRSSCRCNFKSSLCSLFCSNL